jgi:hypothetical protein
MRLAHLLSAAALLAAPLAFAATASAGPSSDYTKRYEGPRIPGGVVTKPVTKIGPFDCGSRPCPVKMDKIPKKYDPGPLRPGPAAPRGL